MRSSFCSSFSTLSANLGALLTAVGFFARLLGGFIGLLVIFPCTWVFRHYVLLVQPSSCRLLVSPGSSHSGIAFCHHFHMPSVELSPSFACFSWCLVTEVSLSLRLAAVCRGSIFLLHGFLLPLGYSSISLMSLLLPSIWRFPLSTTSFSVDCRIRSFSAPPSLGFIPRFPCTVLSSLAILHGWPSFPFHFSLGICGSSPSSYPSFRHFPLFSLGALLPRSNFRFPQRRGPPFGTSQFPIGVLALFTCCLSFAYPSGSLLRSPPATLLPWFHLGSF